MLLPLALVRRVGLRVLTTFEFADYTAPVLDRSFAEQITATEFAAIWRQIVSSFAEADVVRLQHVPETVLGARNPLTILAQAAEQDVSAWSASLPTSFEEFKAARNRRLFADTERQRKRLGAIGPISFEVLEGDSRSAVVDQMIEQKTRRYRETGFELMRPDQEEFYRLVARSPFSTGSVHVSCLRVGEAVVATHLGLVAKDRFYYLMPTYAGGEWGRYSTGRLLLVHLIEWSIRNGLRAFDLTVGDEDYKGAWADTRERLFHITYEPTLQGRAFIAASWTRRATRKLILNLTRAVGPSSRKTAS
jgi:CelD/BcsL family acetyltransferase involved in cellulose biosynthesis